MPKKRENQQLKCRYFCWLIGKRNGVYYADGRSNQPGLGRHSLGTKNYDEVVKVINQLDLTMAVKHGIAEKKLLEAEYNHLVDLLKGRCIYEQYLDRPLITGGPRKTTKKRYRAVLDKFINYAESSKIKFWNQVSVQTLRGYAHWLEKQEYAYRTQYLELTLIKQVLKHLIANQYLPESFKIVLKMRKQNESDTYCWTREQILQMIKMCEHKQLTWLKNVIISLANTGLRIGELIQLNWDDTRSKPGFITIKDNSKSVSNISNSTRTTKTGKTRSLPISPELQILLNEIPYEKKGLIFRGPKGGKFKPDLLRRIFIKEVIQPLSEKYPSTKSEKGFKDGRLHSFRHYFCSVCANSNMPERVLKTWLGHASSDMVRRYYHLHDDDSQSKMNQLSFS